MEGKPGRYWVNHYSFYHVAQIIAWTQHIEFTEYIRVCPTYPAFEIRELADLIIKVNRHYENNRTD